MRFLQPPIEMMPLARSRSPLTRGPLLEQERWERLAALTDDEAWAESQGLPHLWRPGMDGDAGEGLVLQQERFRAMSRPAR